MDGMTAEQAYRAMYIFLEEYWRPTGEPDEIGVLLGAMSTLEHGGTADPAIQEERTRAVGKAMAGAAEVTRLRFTR